MVDGTYICIYTHALHVKGNHLAFTINLCSNTKVVIIIWDMITQQKVFSEKRFKRFHHQKKVKKVFSWCTAKVTHQNQISSHWFSLSFPAMTPQCWHNGVGSDDVMLIIYTDHTLKSDKHLLIESLFSANAKLHSDGEAGNHTMMPMLLCQQWQWHHANHLQRVNHLHRSNIKTR